MEQGAPGNGALTFEVRTPSGASTHAGVLEFTAPEGTVALPAKVAACLWGDGRGWDGSRVPNSGSEDVTSTSAVDTDVAALVGGYVTVSRFRDHVAGLEGLLTVWRHEGAEREHDQHRTGCRLCHGVSQMLKAYVQQGRQFAHTQLGGECFTDVLVCLWPAGTCSA